MPQFTIDDDRDLQLNANETLRAMYALSPYVWNSEGRFDILIRAVNRANDPTQKIARIYHGRSQDGLTFAMDDEPDIAPGLDADDRSGCEDPSVAESGGHLYVYYTGWNQRDKVGKLMLATGLSPCALRKLGVALDSTATHANPKEATIAQCQDGHWVLFFEYACGDRSRIGIAHSEHVAGPWQVAADPLTARASAWDSWHLSPGPILPYNERVLMFYNGATQDGAWRISWVLLDAESFAVVDRCEHPIIIPPPPKRDETDIAFAASAVRANDCTWLYYSIADKQMKRAVLRYR